MNILSDNVVTLLLQQDDCSPDSYESFCNKFEQLVNMSVEDFKDKSFCAKFKMGMKWRHKGFELSWFCDDPFYQLNLY